MTERSVISAVDLHRRYGAEDADDDGVTGQVVHALRGASLEVAAGELIALSGPSGSGKTTMLNCLAGLDTPTAGRVVVLGDDIGEMAYEDRVEWRRQNMSIVFQTTGLLPHLSAAENVDVVLRIRGVSRSERRERVDESLGQLGLGSLSAHRPGELSGGQQQRVSLARALASRPKVLIADEPTGQLDSDTTGMVITQLQALAKLHGITMLMATHDREVEAMADRVVRMVDGVIQVAEPNGESTS